MACWISKRRITDYVDGRLRKREHSKVEVHIRKCDECDLKAGEHRAVRSSLAGLPVPKAPSDLRSKLRVRASRERQFLLESNGSRWQKFWNSWKFRADQLMRPLTLPATGGVLSSVILFSALAVTIGTTAQQVAYEVPVLYADRIDANLVPLQLQLRSSVVLNLSLDGKGRITDYDVRDGANSFIGDAGRLQHNNIMLPQFPSVLPMSQPTVGDIRISFTPIIFRP